MTKLGFSRLCLGLVFSHLATVLSLPLAADPFSGPQGVWLSRRSLVLDHLLQIEAQPSPKPITASVYLAPSSNQPSFLNRSNGQNRSIQWHSGPWDRAWELWTNVSNKLKLVKRGAPLAVEEEIANHLRPTGWRQKFKDLWRKMTFRKLKVTRSQYDQIRKKYSSRIYQPPNPAQYKKGGRFRSAFVFRPALG
ncbi:hypothetical protein NDA18_002536 [Ustilago nuda]|nr:hypothetical protein NDA18_002536 [Ustilago nuda]